VTETSTPATADAAAGAPIVFDRHMSGSDAIMWRIEKNPTLRSTICVVMLLDAPPDRTHLRDKVHRATRVFPRLRQRVVAPPFNASTPVWAVDPHFDLDYHVRFVRAPGDRSLRTVLDMAAHVSMRAFDRARPLWEFVVVDDLTDGRAVVIQKLHHSLTDGIGGIILLQRIFDLDRAGTRTDEVLPPEEPGEEYSPAAALTEALRNEVGRSVGAVRRAVPAVAHATRDPARAARTALDDAASTARVLAPVTTPLSPLMRDRSPGLHFDAFRVTLDDLRATARAAEVKVNDVFMTSLAAGLRRYHDVHDAPVDRLRVTMPINVRGYDAANTIVGGNRFSLARFPVPIDSGDVTRRLRRMHRLCTSQRDEPALAFIPTITDVLNRLPTAAVTAVFGTLLSSIDMVASNVPGVPVPVYVSGGKVLAVMPFGPPAGAACNVTLLSYCGDAMVCVTTDPAAVPDADVFAGSLRDGFAEITGVVPTVPT
jgi:diacylglycerol O-acyltransferase